MKAQQKSRRLTVKLDQPSKGGAGRSVSFEHEVTVAHEWLGLDFFF
jgi:hypothetical protein